MHVWSKTAHLRPLDHSTAPSGQSRLARQLATMTLTSAAGRPYGHIAQIIPNRLFFGSFHEVPKNDDHTLHVRLDECVHYHPFYDDFGPINLGELHKACLLIDGLLKVRVFHLRTQF